MKLIFAGAGASKATSSEKYPTTVEFYDRTNSLLERSNLYKVVRQYLSNQKKKSDPNNEVVIDIEEIIWEVEKVKKFADDLGSDRELYGIVTRDQDLMKEVGGDIGKMSSMSAQLSAAATNLANLINEQVYELYSPLAETEELDRCWMPLLEPLLESGVWVEVVTTNYDQVLEACIQNLIQTNKSLRLETGRVEGVNTTLNASLWEPSEVSAVRRSTLARGLLTKLHGSINWTRRDNQSDKTIYLGPPQFSGNHRRQVIIYPGNKEALSQPPFSLFAKHLANVIKETQELVFIGFAFRDEIVNKLLVDNISPDAKIFNINRSGIPPKFPNELQDQVHDLGNPEGFNEDSVDKLLGELSV